MGFIDIATTLTGIKYYSTRRKIEVMRMFTKNNLVDVTRNPVKVGQVCYTYERVNMEVEIIKFGISDFIGPDQLAKFHQYCERCIYLDEELAELIE